MQKPIWITIEGVRMNIQLIAAYGDATDSKGFTNVYLSGVSVPIKFRTSVSLIEQAIKSAL